MRIDLRGHVAGYCREFSVLPPAVPVAETGSALGADRLTPSGARINPNLVCPAHAGAGILWRTRVPAFAGMTDQDLLNFSLYSRRSASFRAVIAEC